MISVPEAKAIIKNITTVLPPVEQPLAEASGHVLAQDIFATTDIPAFQQSSVDGYAIRFQDDHSQLTIKGEMAAGASVQMAVQAGEAVRIFTGAPLPDGADTVVMQENVTFANAQLHILDVGLKKGTNVRHKGAEVKAGSLAITKGTVLSPAAIGFVAGIGIAKVFVYPMPVVSIIITGNELQVPGTPLRYGQVYESNSYSLRAALQQTGINDVTVFQATDDLKNLQLTLTQALAESDVVLVTGGVSVGAYDFVLEATRACSVQQQFHKVKQRPGKPLYFGTKDSKLVFGLPGNPSSALSCFYNYVLPALEGMSNKKNTVQVVSARLAAACAKQKGLTHFLKAHHEKGTVKPLGAQESFRLSSFAQANALICLDEERSDYQAGETVDVYLLPGNH